MAKHFTAVLVDWPVHLTQKLESGSRDLPIDNSAITPSARALNQAAILQTIEQARNVGIVRDHALPDLAARQTVRPGAAQNAQRVVLSAGKSEFFETGFNLRLDRV